MHDNSQKFKLPVRDTIDFYRARYPGTGIGLYTKDDWNRLAAAYDFVTGATVLDVGVGNGAFLHILARSGQFSAVQGVDIRANSKLIVPEGVAFNEMNITSLTFADDSFDTVVCMEVLEHLEDADFVAGLAQIRRVARSNLVVTVPLEEPHPLWWHDKPGGHRQQFLRDRILQLFPNAGAKIQPRHGTPWIFLVEGTAATELTPVSELLQALPPRA